MTTIIIATIAINIIIIIITIVVQVTLTGFAHYNRNIGLYTKENDRYYVQYLRLSRPHMDVRAPGKFINIITIIFLTISIIISSLSSSSS